MLKNFITTDDLKTFYPNLQTQIWKSQPDYQPQIDKGFDRLWNDLRNRGINPRLVCPPLDLFAETDAVANTPPNLKEFTVTTESAVVRWHGERRLIVECVVTDGTTADVEIYGSNSAEEPLTSSVTWSLVDSVSVSQVGVQTAILSESYRWVYCRFVGTASVSARVYLVDNSYDDLICLAAFKLIFGDIPEAYKKVSTEYDTLLAAVNLSYDDDEDGATDDSEEESRSAQVRFTR